LHGPLSDWDGNINALLLGGGGTIVQVEFDLPTFSSGSLRAGFNDYQGGTVTSQAIDGYITRYQHMGNQRFYFLTEDGVLVYPDQVAYSNTYVSHNAYLSKRCDVVPPFWEVSTPWDSSLSQPEPLRLESSWEVFDRGYCRNLFPLIEKDKWYRACHVDFVRESGRTEGYFVMAPILGGD
jgi:hypothetical protein